jgi:UDP-galactopyranose mutase
VRKQYDWLIVGAGFSGAVLAERIASQRDQSVLVIDRLGHVGGHAHDEIDAAGILVQRYGPQLFHTNSKRVWDYLSGFTQWRSYTHRVRALIEGQLVPVPFNLTSLEMLFTAGQAARIQSSLRRRYGAEAETPVLKMRQEKDADLRGLADYVYQHIFLGYTAKHWGLRPEELPSEVTARVPIRVSRDDRYFRDKHQAMPVDGYSATIRRMLSHRNIDVELGADHRELAHSIQFKRLVYTGSMDEFFGYVHGRLPYRSARFEFETIRREQLQDAGQINYPNDHEFTRSMEFKQLYGQSNACTTIGREYPCAHEAGVNEPLYPIPREENQAMAEKYRGEARKIGNSVIFCGRLGDYEHYTIEQAIARALDVFEQDVCGKGKRPVRVPPQVTVMPAGKTSIAV